MAGAERQPKGLLAHLGISAEMRAWLWGLWLFTSILLGGLVLSPGLSGRLTLGLIAGGFLLFCVARASADPRAETPSSCAAALTPGMRRAYRAGYALMAAGNLVASVAALSRIG